MFAPVPRLGLLVLDEEHETSFKQDNAPRYHARDVGIVRAQAAGAAVVLGSATPSLESFSHAHAGKYRLLRLPHRLLRLFSLRLERLLWQLKASLEPQPGSLTRGRL